MVALPQCQAYIYIRNLNEIITAANECNPLEVEAALLRALHDIPGGMDRKPSGVWCQCDSGGVVVDCSVGYRRLLGYDHPINGLCIYDAIPAGEVQFVRDTLDCVVRSQVAKRLKNKAITPGGEIPFAWYSYPSIMPNGRVGFESIGIAE